MAVEQTSPNTDVAVERACNHFLIREAELLDTNDYRQWLETCMSEDIEYLVPTRTTRERSAGASQFNTQSFHVKDRYPALKVRVDRLYTEHAWAEDPPSRTRRLVTNIRVQEIGPGEIEVKSYLMLYRSQGDTCGYDLLVADRHDTLAEEAAGLRVRKRVVLLDHTILGTPNLGVFL